MLNENPYNTIELSRSVHTSTEPACVCKDARRANHLHQETFDTKGASARVHRTQRRRTRVQCKNMTRGADYDEIVFGPDRSDHLFTAWDVI